MAAAAVTLVLLAVFVCVRPLPEPVLRWALERSAPAFLAEYGTDSGSGLGRVRTVARRAWSNLLSFSLVQAYLDKQPALPETLDDAEFVMARLMPLRRLLLSQNELWHPARDWLTSISGLGYCDQLNREGAMVLAHRFAHAQTFSVSAPDHTAGHVIGRVWSGELRDWLYFDIWPVNVVVFRYLPATGVQVLKSSCDVPRQAVPDGDHLAKALYDHIPAGTILNEYPATFGAYLWSRWPTPTSDLATTVSVEGLPSAVPAAPLTRVNRDVAVTALPSPTDSATWSLPVSDAIAREYMRRRLDLLLSSSRSSQWSLTNTSAQAGDLFLQRAATLLVNKGAAPHVACGAP